MSQHAERVQRGRLSHVVALCEAWCLAGLLLVSPGVGQSPPEVRKTFSPDVITLDGSSELTITVDNTASSTAATQLAFTDVLEMLDAQPLTSNTCGGEAQIGLPVEGDSAVVFSGGEVAAGAVCELVVPVQPRGPAGEIVNVISDFTSSAGASPQATHTLTVLGYPRTRITAGTVLRGERAVIDFTIDNTTTAPLSDLAFDLDLSGVPGLEAVDLPSAPCGPGTEITGAQVLSLSGVGLATGEECAFEATVIVPLDAPLGGSVHPTTGITGTIGGLPLSAPPTELHLFVTEIRLQAFFPYPSPPPSAGSEVQLQVKVYNESSGALARDLAFSMDLESALPGLRLRDYESDCAGAFVEGDADLLLSASEIQPEPILFPIAIPNPFPSCTFLLTLGLPPSAADGSLLLTTSPPTYDLQRRSYTGTPESAAAASLVYRGNVMSVPTLAGRAWLLSLLLLVTGLYALSVRGSSG